MTVKSLENASFVQIKYDFSIRFLLLNECTFAYFHIENDGFLHLAEVQLAEKKVCVITLVLTITYINYFISVQEETIPQEYPDVKVKIVIINSLQLAFLINDLDYNQRLSESQKASIQFRFKICGSSVDRESCL